MENHRLPRDTAAINSPAAPGAAAAAADTSFISIDGVSKQFKTRAGTIDALSAASFHIRHGEFVSVIGPSGCGKSTLLMLLAGLEAASTGKIVIGDKEVQGPTPNIGIVFQQDALLDWRTALSNILLQAEIRKLDQTKALARARELLAMVGLDNFSDAYPHELSGGMRQRVSICRGILHDPPLLLMDEPFGALDALTRDQMQVDLLRLWANRGMTILFVTHSMAEAVFLSDRIVVMSPRPGRVEQIIDVNLERPRRLSMRETPEFTQYLQQVTSIFKTLGVLKEYET